jgi:hypothetical protein
MFVRVGGAECAIIILLIVVLVVGIAISVRLRGE